MATDSQVRDAIRDLTLAGKGVVVVSNTTPQTVNFVAIKAISDCVVNSITLSANSVGASGLSGVTLSGGVDYVLPGSAITLTSGVCVLYNA